MIDFLIDKIIAAKDRESLITASRALDRILSSTNQSNLNITGVVMNAMTEEHHSYGAGYYYNYYQYYYDDKSPEWSLLI